MTAIRKERQGQEMALTAGIVALIVIFSLLPMARLLQEVILPGGQFSLDIIRNGLIDETTWRATWNTLVVGLGGTLFALVLGVAVAILVSLSDVRQRQAFVLCFVTPLMIAPQVTALAWLQLFGPSSPLLNMLGMAPPLGTRNPLYSPEGIVFLLGIQYAPLVFLIVRAGMRKLPRELVEAAQSSGAGWVRVLGTIILPLMTPSIVGAAALTFVSCVGNFGIPAFLGIPANYLVLPTLIYQRLAGGGPDVLSDVAFLSVLIGIIAMVGIVMQDRIASRRDFRITSTSLPAAPYQLGAWRLPVELGMWVLIAFILVLPLVGLILTSLVRGYGVTLSAETATLENYYFVIFQHAAASRAFLNSLYLSAGASIFAVFVAIPLGYVIAWGNKRWIKALNLAIELPYALPGVVLAIASLLLFLKPMPITGIQIYNTVWIILYAYLARFLILAVRPTITGYFQLDRALEEAAQVAGAGLFTRLRTIIFPLIAPAAIAGGLLIFMTALCELTVSALLWSSGSETIGVVIFSFEQGGDSKYAAAVSAIMVATTFLLMLLASLFANKLPDGVLPWRD
ncbi:iron ABC transporter permease [Nitratireductor aquimarinus]|uniref:Iron ABC transporter permease n=1 Tax=Nitratireductor aquimarinus TaxID=889300 RepID=A0ABU4AMV3_9HYPH|nr:MULTISPECIES: iron ABC transporter permease [Alphaproteobacteria]MBY6023090.1 iron ABC transporter permease [Nitratireductor sp. DP7N14-4]MBN7758297.1 iron ABC transporter permease [Nitratireductor aquimarinus]MBN7760883.1 iron ABC transporter permease [Nitratireductor aquibiodomus]MBY6001057.1 iron ABC transporter permease [Tritonibacter mobilis]MDJ1464680.1 iron ABC transporter permease [Nitratireductor sp. GZWM139]